jgi:hypothetical protein
MSDAFFEPLGGDRYRATAHTTGPWDPAAQHGGPPTALLGGAMQALVPQPLSRLTFEILRPVPVADLTVTTSVERSGRAVTLLTGTLADADGPCILARAWGIRSEPGAAPAVPTDAPTMAPRTVARPVPFFEIEAAVGWHTAMELLFVEGTGFAVPGPGSVWARPRLPLVAGRDLTPLERVLLTADAGNGISAAADARRWLFVNVELTVHLHRHPQGEWVGMAASSVYEPDGVGLAASVLHDQTGPIGRGAQLLYVAPNPRAPG